MRTSLPLLGGVLLGALVPGSHAVACGGLFCNQPVNLFGPPPVAQTAENVLFAMERAPNGQMRLEAHVQIFYAGDADKFSWVVPVDSMPSLDVGTNQLFGALLPVTQPTFGVRWRQEGSCKSPSAAGAGGSGGGGSGGAGGSAGNGAAIGPLTPGVDVTFRGDVGPYDASVLRATDPSDPKGLKQWLKDNGYYLPPQADRIIDQYVLESKFFVAIKLISGKGINEIQPLVMRFEGPGPCVPLRLTAIAAINDLRVNLWVLAERRVVPRNFFEIRVNQARIDWLRGGANYEQLVKQAANEAGGNAFVTDYVGSPERVAGQLLPGRYDLTRLAAVANPPAAITEILVQGISRDGTLFEILRKHIPEPEVLKKMNIDERTFYNQLSFYWQRYQADFAPFSGAAFAADIDAKIVQPLVKARALVERFPKLTRLSTYISPEEMNIDPLFMMNDTLPDVPTAHVADAVAMCGQQQYTFCDAPVRLELPDGQKLYFQARTGPSFCVTPSVNRGFLDRMPALEVAWQRDESGPGAVRFDNGATISAEIFVHNLGNRPAMPEEPPPIAPEPRRSYRNGGCSFGGPAGGALLLGLGALILAIRRRR
jgi:hypothetical protein